MTTLTRLTPWKHVIDVWNLDMSHLMTTLTRLTPWKRAIDVWNLDMSSPNDNTNQAYTMETCHWCMKPWHVTPNDNTNQAYTMETCHWCMKLDMSLPTRLTPWKHVIDVWNLDMSSPNDNTNITLNETLTTLTRLTSWKHDIDVWNLDMSSSNDNTNQAYRMETCHWCIKPWHVIT